MTRRIAALLLAASLALAATPAHASPSLTFEGPLRPGALIVGRTDPGARVTIDGDAVRVGADGRFLIGLGRDAEGTIEIAATGPGGARATESLAVEPRSYDIQRIDGLPEKQVSPDPETLARITRELDLIRAARRADTSEPYFARGFAWPVTGPVTGVYGSQRILNGEPRRPHYGVDIAAPAGTPVRAMADGVVALVHEDMFYTGRTVMIDHGHGLGSIYVHMSAIAVADGERVERGAVIGRIGQSGRATGPHLHWGVTLFSTYLDPALVAGPMPDTP